MISRLLKLLHRHPITSTAILFVIGIAVIFTVMVFLSQKTSEDLPEDWDGALDFDFK